MSQTHNLGKQVNFVIFCTLLTITNHILPLHHLIWMTLLYFWSAHLIWMTLLYFWSALSPDLTLHA
jgi:hypothetical protein